MGKGDGTVTHRSPSRAAAPLDPSFGVRALASEESTAGPVDARMASYALWFLRLVLGAVFLQHVLEIVFGYVPPDTAHFFGLPHGVSLFGLGWDALIGLALLYGVWPRPAAVFGAVTLIVAAVAAHSKAGAQYGWQHPILWTAALLAFALAGDGAFTLFPSRFWKESAQ